MDTTEHIEDLKVKLTPEEILAKADQAARTHESLEAVEAEKKESNEIFNDRMKILKIKRNGLLRQVASGEETREVKCRVEKDYDHNTVRVVRTDTDEVIRERAMTFDERQQDLVPLAGGAGVGDPPEEEEEAAESSEPEVNGEAAEPTDLPSEVDGPAPEEPATADETGESEGPSEAVGQSDDELDDPFAEAIS